MGPKKKQEKMSLGNFLSDQTYGSWAEEMDDAPIPSTNRMTSSSFGERRDFGSRPGFGDRDMGGDRQFAQREQLPLPTKPPFTAHLGNLSFDITQMDVESYFSGCEVTNVRIVEDKIDRKPKGFGYVEFASVDGLKKALERNGSQLQGRNIRVSVADPPKDRGTETRELNDWTRKGPLPDLPGSQSRRPSERGSGGGMGGGFAMDDRSERGSRRGPPPEGDGRVRDFGNWERKGPLPPPPAQQQSGPAGEPRVKRNERSFDRRDSPSWGEGRSQEGSRPPRRDLPERTAPERTPTAAELDTQWRSKMRPDPPVQQTPTPDPSNPSSPVATSAAPATRPKLNLQKRTVPEAPASQQAPSAADTKGSNPFGDARPIDSAAREREIEEKRLAVRQKKEEEEKEAAKLKAEKEAKAKAEAQAQSAASAPATSSTPASPPANAPTGPRENGNRASVSKQDGASKENGTAEKPQRSNFELLNRVGDNGEAVPPEVERTIEDDDAPTNGTVVTDKNVLPSEPVVDPSTGTSTGAGQSSTGAALEDDGWSTVPPKGSRKGRGGSRALAS